jgi:hypothetical protein
VDQGWLQMHISRIVDRTRALDLSSFFTVDITTRKGHPHTNHGAALQCMRNIKTLLNVLKENPELTEESTGQTSAADSRQQDSAELDDLDEQVQVSSNLVSFVERLDDELYLSLRLLDNHSPEFLKRLLDIAPLLELAEDVQGYYEGLSSWGVTARLAMRRLEHLYYKHDLLVSKAAAIATQKGDRTSDRCAFINSLAMQVYKYGDDSIKTRAMLCHIYYHALHDRFHRECPWHPTGRHDLNSGLSIFCL